MATVKEEEVPTNPAPAVPNVETPPVPTVPVETVQAVTENVRMAATPAPAVTQPVATPAVPTAPKPTDYKWNPATGKYEAQPTAPTATTPAPVTTPKPTTATAPVVDFNVSTGREAEIQKNLNDITAGNAALLTDRAKYDQAFGYATADAGKKALLDSFFDSKRPKADETSIYAMLRHGQTVPKELESTPAFRTAKLRADAFSKFSGYDAGKFASAIKNGQILPGSQVYKDLLADPNLGKNLRIAEKFSAIYGVDLAKAGESKTNEIVNNSPNAKNAFADGTITQGEWATMVNTPEISAKREETQKRKEAYDKKKAEFDAIEDETRKEFSGAGVSSAYVNAKIADRRKSMVKGLEIAASEYNSSAGTLNDLLTQQAALVDKNLELYKSDQSFARQKELAQFQSDLALTGRQKEFEQKMAQQASLANDPTLATQQMLDSYAEMGIIPQRSASEIVAQVQAEVASGKPLGQVLTELNKAFQSKSEYKAAIEKKFPTHGSDWKLVSVTVDGETKSMERNEKTGEMREIGMGTAGAKASDYGLAP